MHWSHIFEQASPRYIRAKFVLQNIDFFCLNCNKLVEVFKLEIINCGDIIIILFVTKEKERKEGHKPHFFKTFSVCLEFKEQNEMCFFFLNKSFHSSFMKWTAKQGWSFVYHFLFTLWDRCKKMLTYIFILWIAIQIEQIPPYTCVNNFIRFMNLKEWFNFHFFVKTC